MKRLVLMAAAGLMVSLLLLPPVASAAQPKFGLKIGLNSASLNGSDVSSLESDFGPLKSEIALCFGAYAVFFLSEGMAIQVEALNVPKGVIFDLDIDGEIIDLHWDANYIEIPVLFKYTFKTKGSVKPVLFAGPALAFKTSAKLKATYQGDTEEMDIPGFKSTDFGLVFGGGLDIGPKFRVDLRYTMGLTKLLEIDGETSDVKNGVFSLMVGYAF